MLNIYFYPKISYDDTNAFKYEELEALTWL